jgi:hypothetical protein
MKNDLTGNLLAAWREAERSASAARSLAEQAREASAAADAAAEAARAAAEAAGVSLDAADIAVGKARNAYHQRADEVAADEDENSGPSRPAIRASS